MQSSEAGLSALVIWWWQLWSFMALYKSVCEYTGLLGRFRCCSFPSIPLFSWVWAISVIVNHYMSGVKAVKDSFGLKRRILHKLFSFFVCWFCDDNVLPYCSKSEEWAEWTQCFPQRLIFHPHYMSYESLLLSSLNACSLLNKLKINK